MPAIPSSTTAFPPTRILPRAETVTVTASDDDANDLSGGAIAGIVIGSIVGFILLVWLIWSCMRLGAPPSRGGMGEADYAPDRRRSCSPHHHNHHHRRHSSRRHPRREVREYRSTPIVIDGRRRSVSVTSPQRVHTRSRSRGRAVY